MKYTKPKEPTEARLVFELAHRMRNENIEFDLEYTIYLLVPRRRIGKEQYKARLDIVVLKGDQIVGGIEVKRRKQKGIHKKASSSQCKMYRDAIGVPVFMCEGASGMALAMDFARRVSGITLQQ